jgi:hypothetical protein
VQTKPDADWRGLWIGKSSPPGLQGSGNAEGNISKESPRKQSFSEAGSKQIDI